MRNLLRVWLALLILFSPVTALATATTIQGSDGSPTAKTIKVDATGVTNILDAYPREYQQTSQIIVSAVSLDGTQCNTSNPLLATGLTPFQNAAVFGIKWARILVTGTAGDSLVATWSVRFYGSNDGVNYAPIIRGVPQGQTYTISGGTARAVADTLKVQGRGPMAVYGGGSGVQGIYVPLCSREGLPVPFKYIAAVCSGDTAAATMNNVSFTVEITGRQY